MFNFKIVKKNKGSGARAGILTTPHGIIHTPAYMPVATKGALRGIDFPLAQKIGAEVFMVNTYHFYVTDAFKIVKKFGGLHNFLNVKSPLATDSGGFQVFSLGFGMEQGIGKIGFFPGDKKSPKQGKNMVKIDDKGTTFYSPVDGSKHKLDPKISIKTQKILGADIIFAFDECSSPLSSYDYTKKAVQRTHKWAQESLKEFGNGKQGVFKKQALFGIIQGGPFEDLRKESAKFISSLPFFGIGIGGPMGKTKKDMHKVLDWIYPLLPEEKPRHLLGIGEIDDFFEGVERGMDLFDCVMPTRMARRGVALTWQGNINLRKSQFLYQKGPIEKKCSCPICTKYSRSYLSHLVRQKELFVTNLLVYHNLYFVLELIKNIRISILKNNFKQFKAKCLKDLKKK
jgi:queuine tRNA-ribosyltransferase/7-cyano-7-deazaguanine tRNA-ribosyltransferase